MGTGNGNEEWKCGMEQRNGIREWGKGIGVGAGMVTGNGNREWERGMGTENGNRE